VHKPKVLFNLGKTSQIFDSEVLTLFSLDLDDVALSNLLRIIDDVLAVLQMVNALRLTEAITEKTAPKAASKAAT